MMPPRRRHLRMVSSSSDEDDQPTPQKPPYHHQDDESEANNISIDLQTNTINFESVSLNSTNPNPNISHPIPVNISDDDEFIDVSDNLSPPSPPAQNDSTPVEVFDCPISGYLGGLGLRVKREWLDSCIRGLESAVTGFLRLDDVAKAKLCFEQLLYADMNFVGAGVLPGNVGDMHLVDLVGPFVLQVDEIVNISRPLKGRYQNASSGHKRCLKLSMTDGVQRVFGMEYRPIKNLEVLSPAGMKVVVCNVNVRHGILMLVPEVLEVLGGQVEELDAARQRLVQEVNKPARGKRTKSGVVLPLETRATGAAWPPPNGVNAPTQTNIPTPHNARPFQADAQGNTPENVSISQQTRRESTFLNQRQHHEASFNQRTTEEFNTPKNVTINQQTREESTFPNQRQHHEASMNQQTREESNTPNNVSINQQTREESTFPNQRQHHEASMNQQTREESNTPNNVPINQQTREESTFPNQRQHHEASMNQQTREESNTPNNVSINQQTREESTFPNQRQHHEASMNQQTREESNTPNNVSINQQTREESTFPNQRQHHEASMNQQTREESNTPNNVSINQQTREGSTFPNQRQHHEASINQQTREESTAPIQRQHQEANNSSTDFSSLDDIEMLEVEHLPIVTGDEETPFTYLASLSTKWAAMKGRVPNVQGKIKCFMTGVKSFQFRNRTRYELHAYVDDGSLISEILISHDVVQQGIGHSPEEVNAAYRSPDKKIVNEMKNTLLQYQNFLFNFEGTMVVHISEASPLPVAIKLNQGCSVSDAWGLLRRLRSPRSVHQPDAINLSP